MHVLIFVMFSDLCCECLCWNFKFDYTIAVPSSCLTYFLFLNFHYPYHLVSSCGLICNGKSEMYLKVFESNYNYN